MYSAKVHQLRPVKPTIKLMERVARVIAISSGKGGVGKSSVSLNLAIELSRQKHKVCIFDADTNLANINIMTGLSPDFTLQDFLTANKPLQDIMLQGPGGINIIPAASGFMDFVHYDPLQQEKLINLLQQLEKQFDYILIDTAAGINETVLSFIKAAPETIITITSEPTSLTDAFSLLKVLKQQGFNQPIQVLVNRVPSYQVAKEVLTRFSAALKKYLNMKITAPGYVLDDKNVSRSVMLQTPFILKYPETPASLCIKSFASKIINSKRSKVSHLSDYLTEQKELNQEVLVSAIEKNVDKQPWLNSVLDVIQTAPFEESEQLIALLSKHWLDRLESETTDKKYLNSDGYKAAIRFASKLKL
ncbi:MAG: MinD/ParA family protein [Gammaproteobacteria bacterium]|jgi:MinD-like ATPase involved in chromosome partitioning or flagellar assembly|nr:MinD/ParA family protein [Gammaproteobacteria bacterium]MBT4077605.1 MinD/ParA family protein [Gammaproteobacteria bacterium]MBT4194363.1 MinD/ParA family protein [Gammaproteobacteria bacterium]MBT4862068.1 MinD/ParA family protein [Gammaproteobacteria bacterium]MBT6454139.1 MinD/ParA family protein [Gammaproteobacteria bacterium]